MFCQYVCVQVGSAVDGVQQIKVQQQSFILLFLLFIFFVNIVAVSLLVEADVDAQKRIYLVSRSSMRSDT